MHNTFDYVIDCRRMFPTLRVSFSGLRDHCHYDIYMDIIPVDSKRYRLDLVYSMHRTAEHRTLYTVHCTPYTVHRTLYTVNRTLYTVHRTLYTVHRTPYTVHCTPYTVHRTLYTVHCTPYTVHRTLYTVHCTPYTVHRTLYTVHCTPYTVHRTLYTVHCTLQCITTNSDDSIIKRFFAKVFEMRNRQNKYWQLYNKIKCISGIQVYNWITS